MAEQGGKLVPDEWAWELIWMPPRRPRQSAFGCWWRAWQCRCGKHRTFTWEGDGGVWDICHDCLYRKLTAHVVRLVALPPIDAGGGLRVSAGVPWGLIRRRNGDG